MSKRTRARKPKQGRARKKQGPAPKTLVDICMLVFGEWGLLSKAIRAIPAAAEGLNASYRVIVVDNGTPDWETEEKEIVTAKEQSAPIKELLRPQDIFFRLDENKGFPGGYNVAVGKGRSPLILILTSDVFLFPGAITKLVSVLDDPEVGIASPMLLYPADESPHGPPGSVQHAGIGFDIRGDPYHIFMGWQPDHEKVNQRRELQAVTGACILTRRALWQRIGGFSELYNQGTFEDMELAFAIRQMGYKIIFEPSARGEHYVGGSIKHGAMRPGFNLALNSTIFRGRWAPSLKWDTYRFY